MSNYSAPDKPAVQVGSSLSLSPRVFVQQIVDKLNQTIAMNNLTAQIQNDGEQCPDINKQKESDSDNGSDVHEDNDKDVADSGVSGDDDDGADSDDHEDNGEKVAGSDNNDVDADVFADSDDTDEDNAIIVIDSDDDNDATNNDDITVIEEIPNSQRKNAEMNRKTLAELTVREFKRLLPGRNLFEVLNAPVAIRTSSKPRRKRARTSTDGTEASGKEATANIPTSAPLDGINIDQFIRSEKKMEETCQNMLTKLENVNESTNSLIGSLGTLNPESFSSMDIIMQTVWNGNKLIAAKSTIHFAINQINQYVQFEKIGGYAKQTNWFQLNPYVNSINNIAQSLENLQAWADKWPKGEKYLETVEWLKNEEHSHEFLSCPCLPQLNQPGYDHTNYFRCATRRYAQNMLLEYRYQLHTNPHTRVQMLKVDEGTLLS